MSAQPDLRSRQLELLSSVCSRLRLQHALKATAAATAGASVAGVIVRIAGGGIGTQVAAGLASAIGIWLAAFAATRQRRTRRQAAALVERVNPSLQNVVITAEQIMDDGERTPSYMRARVLSDAAARSSSMSGARVVTLTPSIGVLFAGIAIAAGFWLISGGAPQRQMAGSSRPAAPSALAGPVDLIVDVTPPRYTARASVHFRNPRTIEALAGSRAAISLTGRPASADPRMRVNGVDVPLRATATGWTAEITLNESGYLAVDRAGARGQHLVPLSVIPDRVPAVTITAPGRDLRIDRTTRAIPIRANASDDLGLSSMEIRYTRISGTEEQVEFHEGTLPSSIDRQSGETWQATAQLALAAMKLEPGDALVYRAIARDGRPGDMGLGTSDTYFVEVAGPGEVPLEGFDMPPDRERYALSQQMIVLKIERLRARESSMTRGAVQEAAANIGAEQRAVRANFVFLLGGSVEDEEAEAQESTDILEGRLENQSRREILEATRLMSLAERALGTASTADALPPARAAARALQRAFGHSRYLLRTLPARARVDPARRLTGDRASAQDWRRGTAAGPPDSSTTGAREALGELLRISAMLPKDGGAPADRTIADRLGRLAERVLGIESNAADLQAASRELESAVDALGANRVADARAAIRRAAPPILSRAQRGRTDAAGRPLQFDRLTGALTMEGERR